ncbi:MAG: 50S ribosomal protein L2 [archaeon]
MGKNLIQQARGKGGPTYRAPSFRWKGAAKLRRSVDGLMSGEVKDIIRCQGHSAPLCKVTWADGDQSISICPEGIRVGQEVSLGAQQDYRTGHSSCLGDIPEGTLIFNIESQPGDGGKFVRASGTFAKIVAKAPDSVTVLLPSKKRKNFNRKCRASVGIVAGGGRTDKPFVKAGKKYHAMKAKNKLYPSVSGNSQNAVDHPFGGSSSAHKGRPTIAPKNAPPGRKVGKLHPRRTGKKR